MIVLYWNIRGLGNDPARNMLNEIRRAYSPDIIAIAKPKILISDLRPSFWTGMNMVFVDENSRGSNLHPNLWVACNSTFPTLPVVIHKSEQVIKMVTIHGDLYYGFVHAANNYVDR